MDKMDASVEDKMDKKCMQAYVEDKNGYWMKTMMQTYRIKLDTG
jgi:hypothetical protein